MRVSRFARLRTWTADKLIGRAVRRMLVEAIDDRESALDNGEDRGLLFHAGRVNALRSVERLLTGLRLDGVKWFS